jgi:hypothetical protein
MSVSVSVSIALEIPARIRIENERGDYYHHAKHYGDVRLE